MKISRWGRLAAFLFSLALLASCGGRPAPAPVSPGTPPSLRILTTFYPILVMTRNITQGVEGVEVENLTAPATGCLHDYALTTADMKRLGRADILIVNGGGIEAFLEKARAERPELPVVEAVKGMELILEGAFHRHESGRDLEFNPHVWASVSGAMAEVRNISEQLVALDPPHAAIYRANAAAYLEKLAALKTKMHDAAASLPERRIVTFHDAFSYFAKEFDLEVVAVIESEPGGEPSAKELAETIRLVREKKVKALFIEPQYSSRAAETIARESGAKIYVLDPAVTGEDDADAYIRAMERNLEVLKEALGKR